MYSFKFACAFIATKAACALVKSDDEDLDHIHECRERVLDGWNEVSGKCFLEDDIEACFDEAAEEHKELYDECSETILFVEATNLSC